MRVLFLNGPVVEDVRFQNPAFVRSGNLAVGGIAEGLFASIGNDLTCWTSQSMPSWPRYKQLFIRYYKLCFPSGLVVRTMPAVNVIMVREFCRGFLSFWITLFWCLRNIGKERCVITYNFYTPPFGFPLLAARLTHTPIVPIVFDIGLPLTNHGGLRNWIYARAEKSINKYCQKIRGACVITKHIQETYLADRHAMILDGGLGLEILRRLFPLERSEAESRRKETVFVLAGRLVHYNGIDLAIEAMKCNKNPDIRLIVAGNAASAFAISEMAKDSRIDYRGLLNLDELFDLYREADVIMNIRLTKEMDTRNWFPSKFIEALATGRQVLSTNMGHMKSVYSDYCAVLEDETPEGLSVKMDELSEISRSERDKMGGAARDFMLKGHTWDLQIKRLLRYCHGIYKGEYANRIGIIEVELDK